LRVGSAAMDMQKNCALECDGHEGLFRASLSSWCRYPDRVWARRDGACEMAIAGRS
jgi:hypothetical protein